MTAHRPRLGRLEGHPPDEGVNLEREPPSLAPSEAAVVARARAALEAALERECTCGDCPTLEQLEARPVLEAKLAAARTELAEAQRAARLLALDIRLGNPLEHHDIVVGEVVVEHDPPTVDLEAIR